VHIAEEIARHGGSASLRELRESGWTLHKLEVAVRSESIVRLRRGWYGVALNEQRLAAGRVGGAVSCITALRLRGVWVMPHDAIHVRIARGTEIKTRAGLKVHWTAERVRCADVDGTEAAISCAVDCVPFEAAVVALDSAVNRRLISASEVRAICSSSARGRRAAAAMDPASESGIETLARLRLRRRNLKVRTQVWIPDVGRVDLVIGDRLVLELDGRAWHDRPGDFEADRRRDRALVAAGYLAMRASYAQVMGDWDTIESQILRLVRARRHLARVPFQ
jgi:very-short-patch-repair endonuclease